MLRRSSLVALLSATGCFAEPSLESSETDEGTSSQGTSTRETEAPPTSQNPGSTGPETSNSSDVSSSTDDCPAGQLGCPCDESECEDEAACIEGVCGLPIPTGCGDGVRVEPEQCDDGNNDPGDGCSPTCRVERECFLAHLGGPGKTSVVQAYSVNPDGMMQPLGQQDVPGHNPPPSGPGSELSRAAVSCRGLVYVASSTSGTLTGLRTIGDDVTEASMVALPGVRELACDAELGLLFAVQSVANGFTLTTFDVGNGELSEVASATYAPNSGPGMRATRLSLDRDAQRVVVSFVDDTPPPTPVSFLDGTYSPGGLSLNPIVVDDLGTLRDELAAVLYVPPANQLLGVGAGSSSGRLVYRLPLTEDGFGLIDVQPNDPWEDRRNIWPLRLPGGDIAFALGGTNGVFLAVYPSIKTNLPIEMIGDPVATALTNTFARTAFDDSILIVASPEGLETYDLTGAEGNWTRLDDLVLDAPETFTSGAVVPCP
ncbi:MAG: hypothetical protein KUG77_08185 [Nannocystaceae bacterium]|nr:hypothetical protein [Nannocystaceae bacterium]